jgi:hypothetical protein
MNKLVIPLIVFATLCSANSCGKNEDRVGCMDRSATNYDIAANVACSSCCVFPPKKGGVLFYISDASVISRCGNVMITLSTGQQTIISGYYPVSPPATCVNQVGGYMLLDVGTYQYTITSPRCAPANGTLTVVEGCNKIGI